MWRHFLDERPTECDYVLAAMIIHLVADDSELEKLCRDVLAETPELGCSWTLVSTSPGGTWKEADLYILDFQPDVPLPAIGASHPLRRLFLVHPKDLQVFQKRTGLGEGNVLLKPVLRSTLSLFLVAAISSGSVESLRADRDEILQCLIQTNLKLQEYDHERTAFLTRALHDFRAPLTALNGYCGLLLTEPLGELNESQSTVLRRMQDSARRLSRMSAAMYELSAGRQVTRRPDLRPGNLRDCAEQALHEMALFAEEKSIAISVDFGAGAESLYFETGQVEQVFINILDNACRFTPRSGLIEIRGYPFFWERRRPHLLNGVVQHERRRRALADANSYRVDISDSGAPIPEDLLDAVFDEYTALAGGRDRSGGGLGLAICRMILRRHQGCIWAENHEFGPVFSFVLPLRPADTPPCPALDRIIGRQELKGIGHAT
jgi:signal transduction histidine kinase